MYNFFLAFLTITHPRIKTWIWDKIQCHKRHGVSSEIHVSFQMAHLKRNVNFDHSRCRFEFRWPFGVSSFRKQALRAKVMLEHVWRALETKYKKTRHWFDDDCFYNFIDLMMIAFIISSGIGYFGSKNKSCQAHFWNVASVAKMWNPDIRRGGGKEKKKRVFGTKPKARAGWPKRLRLIRVTPLAEVDVIRVKRC